MAEAIVLLGATATGKTAVALALARELAAEIVNADALQAYRGLDIGTGKPSLDERRSVPHHLFDVLDPHETFSAGDFARRARLVIGQVVERGALPIVVGGSGFYLRALLDGLSPLPVAPPELRRSLQERGRLEGASVLHAELERLDPVSAARLPVADRQRVVRALEVTLLSGRPFSDWLREPPAEPPLDALRVGLTLPRPILYDRIGARVRAMVEAGWLDEVLRLLREGVDPQCPAFQAIGYRELTRCALGETSLAQAMDETVQATRRFAKRQDTWFRRERDVQWVVAEDSARATAEIQRLMRGVGLGRSHDDEAQHQYPGWIPVSEPQGGSGGGG